jgi:hypothetical protein
MGISETLSFLQSFDQLGDTKQKHVHTDPRPGQFFKWASPQPCKKREYLQSPREGLADDARTCGDPHLDHDHAQKRFYRIRTDFHPRGDLLGRQTIE